MSARVPYLENVLQCEEELAALAALVRQENVSSLLEIGSKYGGSLWRLACAMPEGSRVVAVDLPNGTRAWKESQQSLRSCIHHLQAKGYEAHVVWGDSMAPDVIKRVSAWAPFDLVFIDANHTLEAVTKDWFNYGIDMQARLVAFHDIAWEREDRWKLLDLQWQRGIRIEVPVLWNKLKQHYRHEEFKVCPSGNNNGIGVLWRSG